MFKRNAGFVCAALLLISCSVAAVGGEVVPKSLTVALVTSRSLFGDVQVNLDHFEKLIGEAASGGARLVCFPELSLVGYSTHPDVLKAAQPIPGPATQRLTAIAKHHNVYLSVGMAEREAERHFITQIVVGPDGYLGKYRKCFPTGTERACGFQPGNDYPTWDVDGFRFGIVICADGRQESTIQEMKKAEADVIHHPHGNYVGNLGRNAEEWTRSKLVYIAPRALTSRAHILINNSAGDMVEPTGIRQFGSGALVIDSLGQVVRRTEQRDRTPRMILVTLAHPLSLIPRGELQKLAAIDSDLGWRVEREVAFQAADDLSEKQVELKRGDRIIFFGDSLTALAGREAPKEHVTKGYVRIVREMLAARQPDNQIEVEWVATGGHTVPDLLKRVDNDVIAKRPTIVVIQIGCNDARRVPKETFQASLEQLIDKLQAANIQVVQCTLTSVGEKHDGANKDDPNLEAFAEVERQVARAKNVPLNDLRRAFVAHWKQHNPDNQPSGVLTYDGNHFNQAGHNFVAEQMLKKFK